MPPWVAYPAYPPGDIFWRMAGEPYLFDVWWPFWKALTSEQQTEYLARWNVPDTWKDYLDPKFQKWLNEDN